LRSSNFDDLLFNLHIIKVSLFDHPILAMPFPLVAKAKRSITGKESKSHKIEDVKITEP
jgi:hypothetical protein